MIQKRHPIFTHNCSDCNFLGAKEVSGQLYDFYFCPKKESSIVRYGSSPEEYLWLPSFLLGTIHQTESFKTCLELQQTSAESGQ